MPARLGDLVKAVVLKRLQQTVPKTCLGADLPLPVPKGAPAIVYGNRPESAYPPAKATAAGEST